MKSAKSGKLQDTRPVILATRVVPTDYNNLNFLKYRNVIKTSPENIVGDIEVAWNLRVEKCQ